ncbi:RraA family protein [Pseudomonas sp. EpS/L25]|uniref:RraA family protein n=1 Tax=Pseudomonas sp. EpS/L25 TaxID=1749078 RepID=UPI0007436FD4|nr:RraA family protein [Pseudomonas sp. EpS/L25]KUM43411.1 dimethylmenaquinone methyltransferase [Pseudomonas sp. EpS/L25]
MSLPGLRINPAVPPVSAEIAEAFQSVVTPHISDNLSRHIGVNGLTRYNHRGKLVGTALTIKTRPGDNLFIYKALPMIQPGHILVIDAQGDTTNAVLGELIKLYADSKGCVGYIVNGAIRDVAAFASTPLYACGVTHRGPYKSGPGEINVPVTIGGQIINPGDIIIGDEDGVVSFAQDQASEILALARRTNEMELAIQAEIASGRDKQSWLEKYL